MSTSRSGRRRFPASELLRFLVLPIVLTIIVVLVFMKPWRNDEPARQGAFEQVELVQKGGLSAVTSLFGGPTGSVWYTPTGSRLELRLSAEDLEAGKRYIFEIQVDSTVYDVASIPADDGGRITLDSAFSGVAEGTCVGRNYDPPVSFESGRSYSLGFMLKRDGNAASGAQPVPGGGGAGEAELRCTGNGDGNYKYALLENRLARFTVR
ncbi:MAG TPA: hypothetical protein VFK04_00625 [Gemmatimonadaceae bacterium]|jgi:hypothetical protein|nr:hypothetical protein [Gemmatimonadaceae bacterium]